MKPTSLLSLFLALLLPFVNIHSQTHIQLILATKVPIDSAHIYNFSGKELVHVPFKDTLEMDFKNPTTGYYHINYIHKGKVYNVKLYLDTGSIMISMVIENDKLSVEKLTGSLIYDMTKTWKKQLEEVMQRKDSALLDSFLLRTYEEQIDNIFSFSIGGRYLNIHQNDKLKLYALLPLIAKQTDILKAQFGFSIFNDRLQGIIRNNNITLSAFSLTDTKNKTVRAQSNNQRLVILDFWFVGCIPCMEDHVKIKSLLPLFEQKQAELISISNDDSFEKWKEYLKKNKYSWQQYKKPSGIENILTQLGISIYPTYVLLSKTGQILFSTYSLEEMIKQL